MHETPDRHRRLRSTATVIAIATLILLARCGPAARQRITQLLFDVPSTPGAASRPGVPLHRRRPTPTLTPRHWINDAQFVSRHPPFLTRDCAACHDRGNAQQPRPDLRTVCGKCHTKVLEARPFQHGPFAAGACAECHQPHVAALPKLLRDPDPRQCLNCHDMQQFPPCKGRRTCPTTGCLTCHDPHSADVRFILRPREQWEYLMKGGAAGVHPEAARP